MTTPQSTRDTNIPNEGDQEEAHEGAYEGAHNEDEITTIQHITGERDHEEEERGNLRRSKRKRQLTTRMIDSIQQEHMEMPINLQSIKCDDKEDNFLDTEHVLSVAAPADPDTMYWDQAITQVDAVDFIQAAVQEIETHQQQGHWEVVPIEDVPPDTKVLDTIWSMKRKRKLKTNQVYKHKARLIMHGG
jgi:hypothetical protein